MRQEAKARLVVQDNDEALALFGKFDEHLKLLERAFPVQILPRGTELTIYGNAEDVDKAQGVLRQLLEVIQQGNTITLQDVRYTIQMIKGEEKLQLGVLFDDIIIVTNRGKEIKPKTKGQKAYVDAMRRDDIVFGIGPAGTGKTYLAMAMAVQALKDKEVNRIILTRPAVEAGEKLGFLPGDLQDKVDPYLRPLYDALYDILGIDTFRKYLEKGIIEVAPLAYMRGRTLDDLSSSWMRPRIPPGTNENVPHPPGFWFQGRCYRGYYPDRPSRGQFSGLEEVQVILKDIPGISFVYLTKRDVVRHALVRG